MLKYDRINNLNLLCMILDRNVTTLGICLHIFTNSFQPSQTSIGEICSVHFFRLQKFVVPPLFITTICSVLLFLIKFCSVRFLRLQMFCSVRFLGLQMFVVCCCGIAVSFLLFWGVLFLLWAVSVLYVVVGGRHWWQWWAKWVGGVDDGGGWKRVELFVDDAQIDHWQMPTFDLDIINKQLVQG